MFKSVGTTEVVIIAIVLLILFGGKKLPELGRGLGDAIRQFKKSLGGDDKK